MVDYLLKPFSFQRFCKAIGRLSSFEHKDTGMSGSVSSLFTTLVDPIIIKTETGEEKIQPGDIQYIESLGNFIKINTQQQRYVIRETLAGFLLKLPPGQFIRVHRSYVVAVSFIELFTENSLRIASRNIPVGNVYKADLRDVLGVE